MQHMALGYAQPAEQCCWAGRQAWSSVLAALPPGQPGSKNRAGPAGQDTGHDTGQLPWKQVMGQCCNGACSFQPCFFWKEQAQLENPSILHLVLDVEGSQYEIEMEKK